MYDVEILLETFRFFHDFSLSDFRRGHFQFGEYRPFYNQHYLEFDEQNPENDELPRLFEKVCEIINEHICLIGLHKSDGNDKNNSYF